MNKTSKDIIKNLDTQLGTVGEYCVSVSKQEMSADDAINHIREYLVDHRHDVDTYDVLHAEWLDEYIGYDSEMDDVVAKDRCSNCNKIVYGAYDYKYCPYCGARVYKE